MPNSHEIPTCPSTLMCAECKGIGTLGGSMYITESCAVCKGTGMVRKEGDGDE